MSAVNVILLALAAVTGTAAVNRYLLPARRSTANLLHAIAVVA